MKFSILNRRWTQGGLALAVVLAAVWWSQASVGGVEAAPVAGGATGRPALTVRTTMLREEQWARSLFANGSILPWQEAVIGAQLPGLRIAEVKVGIGDRVKSGDLLLTLGNQARNGADYFVQGRVIAPDDGVISAANASVGSMVKSGDELFRLIRKGRLEWRAELTAEELMLLRKGMSAEVTVGERIIKGKVRAISPAVDPKTRYGYALVSLPDSRGIIAGAFARGNFDVSGGKSGLQTLPQSAVMQRGEITYVLTVGAGNHVHEQVVTLGQRLGNRVEIKQGLAVGEAAIESGGAFLTEGDVVRVLGKSPLPNPLPRAGEGANTGPVNK